MILALDVGATNIKVALFDTKNMPRNGEQPKGVGQANLGEQPNIVEDIDEQPNIAGQLAISERPKIVEQAVVPTNAEQGFDAICASVKKAISLFADKASAVAIASAGDVDGDTGVITYATGNLPGMTGFDYKKFVWENFRLHATALNDAHAAILGEVRYGVGNVGKRVAMLTLGSGVGGGYCVDGKICATAANDFARFGHICLQQNGRPCNCGKFGCVESYLSGRALHKDAAEQGVDGSDLFEKFQQASPQHLLFVQNFCRNFQMALNKIDDIAPFDVCIVGGGVVDWIGESFDDVFDKMNKKIVRADLGNLAGVYGALVHMCDKGVVV